jgi:hypothetical protein
MVGSLLGYVILGVTRVMTRNIYTFEELRSYIDQQLELSGGEQIEQSSVFRHRKKCYQETPKPLSRCWF